MKGIVKPPSIVTRIGLTEDEFTDLRHLSHRTGVPLSRLIADAVRSVHLEKADLGDARGVRSGDES